MTELDLLPFDITAPLPEGPTTTLLEASAGTGKTWTIGALVTRYVAEGRARLEQLLVVTFGRMASRELRERVRVQLVDAERALGDPASHRGRDALLDLLLDGDEEELDRRHRRVRAALASYDAATIATTHQFCAEVLGSLGVAGDSDSRAELVEDLVCLDRASGGFAGLFWALALVPLLTLSWAGSALPLAYWGLMLFGWFTLTPEGSFSWWSLPAAAGVAVGHAAAALGASVPPATQLARRELLRWARATGLAAAAALPVGTLAGVLAGHGELAGPAALVIGLLGLAAAVLLVRTEPPAERA